MSSGGKKSGGDQVIVTNRRARFDYDIADTFEAGLVLLGSEVKSMRAGHVDIVDAYGAVERGEAYLKQLYVAPFEQAKAFPHEPRRARKLLLHTREIEQLDRAITRDGFTIVPLKIYVKNGRIKVELGVARGKKKVDKRQDIKKKAEEREARKAMGVRIKGGSR